MAKLPIDIRDGQNILKKILFDDGDTNGLVPYHYITGSVVIDGATSTTLNITSSDEHPVFITASATNPIPVSGALTVQNTFDVPLFVTSSIDHPFYVRITSSIDDQVYVTSSDSFPLYITASYEHPVSVKVSSSADEPVYVSSSKDYPLFVTASEGNPFYVRITSSIDDQLYVTSSDSNPLYITASYEHPVSVSVSSSAGAPVWVSGTLSVASSNDGPVVITQANSTLASKTLYTDSSSYGGKTGVNLLTKETGTPDYYHFSIPSDGDRKQLLVYNNCLDADVDQSLYISIGADTTGEVFEGAPVIYSFPLPTANFYSADLGTANLAHNIYVLSGSRASIFINVTEIT